MSRLPASRLAALIVATSVATIFVLALLYPFDDLHCSPDCGSTGPQNTIFIGFIITVVTCLILGALTKPPPVAAAAFGAAAVFAYVLASAIDYQFEWRNVHFPAAGRYDSNYILTDWEDVLYVLLRGGGGAAVVGCVLGAVGSAIARVARSVRRTA